MLTLHAINAEVYRNATADQLSAEDLYFLLDTGEVMRGEKPFTEPVVFYDGTAPAVPARKKIYLNTTTGEGKVYDGTAWRTVIRPVADTLTKTGTNLVPASAIVAYVKQQLENAVGSDGVVASLAFDKTKRELTVTDGAGTETKLPLEGLGVDLKYDKATGKMNVIDMKGDVLGTGVSLDLERFVKGGSYDHTSKKITLWFDNAEDAASATDKIEIPVGDLVDTYTAADSSTIHMTVTGNKFTAEAIVSAAAGNLLEKKDDGLYVAASALAAYQKLVASADTVKIPMLNADGQIINGRFSAGGEALAETPTATVLATELAVSALVAATKTEITTELAKKMALVNGATENAIATFNANGQVKDSGKLIGGATLAATPNANTLATEAAVAAALGDKVDKSAMTATLSSASTNDQVPTAKAVYDQLTWKTTL